MIVYHVPEVGSIKRDSVLVFDQSGKQVEGGYVVDHERGVVTFGTWEDALRTYKSA